MKKHAISFIAAAAALLALAPGASATDVGVSINVGQPNFYGRIDIGSMPRPQVIYAEPVVIERRVHYVDAAPIYLRVPPGHEKHWGKHCARYDACGRPVYFVRDSWYRNEYVPRYRESDRHHEDRDGWRDDDRHEDHGHGHGHKKGHGKGHGKGHDKH